MSAEDVGVVKAIHQAVDSGDYDAALPLIHEETEFYGSADISAGEDGWRGHGGVQRGFAQYLEAWDEYRLDVRAVIDCGDQVFVEALQHGRGRGSGVEMSERLYLLWTIRGGKATKLKTFRERGEAREAAGLPN